MSFTSSSPDPSTRPEQEGVPWGLAPIPTHYQLAAQPGTRRLSLSFSLGKLARTLRGCCGHEQEAEGSGRPECSVTCQLPVTVQTISLGCGHSSQIQLSSPEASQLRVLEGLATFNQRLLAERRDLCGPANPLQVASLHQEAGHRGSCRTDHSLVKSRNVPPRHLLSETLPLISEGAGHAPPGPHFRGLSSSSSDPSLGFLVRALIANLLVTQVN